MMLRIAILALLAAAGAFFTWRRLKPPKLLVVPARWKGLARKHAPMKEALQARQAMIKLAMKSPVADAGPLAADIDALIDAIADMSETRSNLRTRARGLVPEGPVARDLRNGVADIDQAIRGALDQLHELHTHLVRVTGAEIDAAVHEVRLRLAERKQDMAFVLEGHREVQKMLDDRE